MFTLLFWKATLERALKTAAQSAALVVGQDVLGADLFAADFGSVASFAAGGFVLSVLTSVGSAAVTSEPGPSLSTERLEVARHAAGGVRVEGNRFGGDTGATAIRVALMVAAAMVLVLIVATFLSSGAYAGPLTCCSK